MIAGLQPYQAPQPLAYNGAGGANAGAPPDATQPPAPAPVAADYGPPPGMSGPPASMPEPNASNVNAPPPAPPPAAAQPRALPGRPPPVGGGGAPADGGVNLDPSQIPRSPRSDEEAELRAIEDARFRQLAMTPPSPVRKIPAAWMPTSRSTEQRERPDADLEELRAAQQAAAESDAKLLEEKAKAEKDQLALEADRSRKDAEFQARQDAATRKFQEETARIEGELEAERKALNNPNDFWDSTSTAQQVGLAIFAGLGGFGGAINGDPEAGARIIKGAIDRHVARRRANVDALVAKRGRGKEDFDLQGAALQAERATALRQVDGQIKATIAQGQNPILRQLLEEDVPITPEAVEASLMKGAKSDVGKDTAERRLVFEMGPDGQLRAREAPVRYLVAEHARNVARLQAARENLGYAREYASVQQRSERYIPEQRVGGGGGMAAALKLREQQLKDRISRGEKVTEQDYKAAGILAPIAGQRQKASEERAEKEGARTVQIAGKDYTVRPGTSEKEMVALRDLSSGASVIRQKAKELSQLKRTDPDYGAKSKILIDDISAAKSLLRQQGTVTDPEAKRNIESMTPALIIGEGGPAALNNLANSLDAEARIKTAALGGKAKR